MLEPIVSTLIKAGKKAASDKARRRAQLARQLVAQNILEASMARQVAAVLNRYAIRVSRLVAEDPADALSLAEFGLQGMEDSLSSVFDKNIERAFKRFRRIQEDSQKSLIGDIETKDIGDFFANAFDTYIATRAADMVASVTATTRSIIRKSILRSIKDGISGSQMAKQIRTAAGGAVGASRAKTIARTEIHSAAQASMDATAKSTGLKFRKFWVATDDERTRETHLAAEKDSEDRIITEDDFFNVGGHPAQFPGDPALPVEESVNCRCGTVREPILDEEGGLA